MIDEEFDLTKRLIKLLSNYYGGFDSESAEFIKKNFYISSSDELDRVLSWIYEHQAKNFGFPDIKTLSECKKAVPTRREKKTFVAAKCDLCGTVYSYRMLYCPTCYDKGYYVEQFHVIKSENPIDAIKFNWPCPKPDKASADLSSFGDCYACDIRYESYCSHFGDENWDCREFRNCKCNTCCMKAKRFNQSLIGRKKTDVPENIKYEGFRKVAR